MRIYPWIALGSAIGGVARYWFSQLVAGRVGDAFPWGTLAVNVSGSFLIGFFATVTGPDGRWLVEPETRQFLMLGICGGYTTFSSFSLQTLELAWEGDWLKAGANVLLSVVLNLVAVAGGHLAARFIHPV